MNIDQSGFLPLIRCASEVFDAPVIFTDKEYRLISLYPSKKIGDYVYDTLLEEGSLSDDTIAAFHEAYLRQPGTRYEPFFENQGLVKDCPRIFAEVYDDTKILGHIAIFLKDKEFKAWQLEAASFLTSALRVKINLSKYAPSVHVNSLRDLLDPTTSTQAKSRSIAQLEKLNARLSMLLVAPLDQSKSQQAFASIAINYLLLNFPDSIAIEYKDDLVILLTDQYGSNNLKDTAEKISEYLFQYKILCGAVYPIKDLYTLHEHYIQARATAVYRYWYEITNNNSHTSLYYYNHIAPYPLFLYLSQNEAYKAFIHPLLKEIETYDNNNNTDFYLTLDTYCKNLFLKNETAENLHIHRNTLNYRLSRIEELFKLDLKDFQTLLHLLISLEISVY